MSEYDPVVDKTDARERGVALPLALSYTSRMTVQCAQSKCANHRTASNVNVCAIYSTLRGYPFACSYTPYATYTTAADQRSVVKK